MAKTATKSNGDHKAKTERADPRDRYIAEIDRFAATLRDQQDSIKDLEKEVAVAKTVYDEARHKLSEAKDVEHSTVTLLLKFIRPGSIDVMPLFDTMEEADEELMGLNADEWRKEPIVALDLSAAAMRALIDADVVLVGQLQDRILASEKTDGEWAAGMEGINEGMAQAIEAKLASFIEERSRKRKK